MTQPSATERWSAVVIGAGPAGSIAARELARRGIQTVLLDKARFPRAKVCGGCLNGNALAALSAAGLGHIPQSIGASPIERIVLAANGRCATISLPHGMAVSRSTFDWALVHEAENAGVTFRSGVKASLGELDGEVRLVEVTDGLNQSVIAANVVIVADGLNGRASHVVGADATPSPHSRLGAGVVVSDTSTDYAAQHIHMATAGGGYVGLVRVEENQLDIAAAFDPAFVRTSGGLGLAAERILREAGFPAVPGLAMAAWKGTPALTRHPAQIAGPRWFAVGDAAGYVEPFTGEGMAWAMSGARAVAEIAAQCVETYSDELLREWTRTHRRLVGQRQWFCIAISRLLRSRRACRLLVFALSMAPSLAVPFVRGLNRPTRFGGGIA